MGPWLAGAALRGVSVPLSPSHGVSVQERALGGKLLLSTWGQQLPAPGSWGPPAEGWSERHGPQNGSCPWGHFSVILLVTFQPHCLPLVEKFYRKCWSGASLVAQWLRIHLPVQGTRVRALVREDSTRRLSSCGAQA